MAMVELKQSFLDCSTRVKFIKAVWFKSLTSKINLSVRNTASFDFHLQNPVIKKEEFRILTSTGNAITIIQA